MTPLRAATTDALLCRMAASALRYAPNDERERRRLDGLADRLEELAKRLTETSAVEDAARIVLAVGEYDAETVRAAWDVLLEAV